MATIYDVAKRAGVSPATVSNAFNKPNLIKPATLTRILAAADELSYVPNEMAQALAKGTSQMIGLLVSDIRIPIVSNVTRGIEDYLVQKEFLPIIASTDGDSEKTIGLLQKLQRRGASGFIIIPAQFGVPDDVLRVLEELNRNGIPIVVAGHDLHSATISQLCLRGQESVKELIDHLISYGHTSIGYISAAYSKGLAIRRYLGYQESLLLSGIPYRPELVIETENTPQASFEAMEKLMALPNPPTAIFANNDIYARGVIDYCNKNGLTMPDDLSLVTFDYLALAQRTTPRLTSIVVSAYDLGWQSAELFCQLRSDPSQKPIKKYLDHTLEVRETTAPLSPPNA